MFTRPPAHSIYSPTHTFGLSLSVSLCIHLFSSSSFSPHSSLHSSILITHLHTHTHLPSTPAIQPACICQKPTVCQASIKYWRIIIITTTKIGTILQTPPDLGHSLNSLWFSSSISQGPSTLHGPSLASAPCSDCPAVLPCCLWVWLLSASRQPGSCKNRTCLGPTAPHGSSPPPSWLPAAGRTPGPSKAWVHG